MTIPIECKIKALSEPWPLYPKTKIRPLYIENIEWEWPCLIWYDHLATTQSHTGWKGFFFSIDIPFHVICTLTQTSVVKIIFIKWRWRNNVGGGCVKHAIFYEFYYRKGFKLKIWEFLLFLTKVHNNTMQWIRVLYGIE